MSSPGPGPQADDPQTVLLQSSESPKPNRKKEHEAFPPLDLPRSPSPMWLDVILPDVSERVARFTSRGQPTQTLRHLAQTSPQQHLACVAALDGRVDIYRKPNRNDDDWGRILVGHVRELECHCSTRLFCTQPRLLPSLMFGSQLRRIELHIQGSDKDVAVLPRRSWDGVEVDLAIWEDAPFDETLQLMRDLKPRRVVFRGSIGRARNLELNEEGDKWASKERLFEALKGVSEIGLRRSTRNWVRWVPLLSRLPGCTSLDMTTELRWYPLEDLRKIDEICIRWDKDAILWSLPDCAAFGSAVVDLDLRRVNDFVPGDFLESLAQWFPNLRRLKVGLQEGSERHLPVVLSKLSKLTKLWLVWPKATRMPDADRYYQPAHGTIVEGIRKCNGLSKLQLRYVDLDAHDLELILQHLGGRVDEFETCLDRGPMVLEKTLAVGVAAARHCPALHRLHTHVTEAREWRFKSETWTRRLRAAGGQLERRCIYLDTPSLNVFFSET